MPEIGTSLILRSLIYNILEKACKGGNSVYVYATENRASYF